MWRSLLYRLLTVALLLMLGFSAGPAVPAAAETDLTPAPALADSGVELAQVPPVTADPAPQTISGRGQQVSGPFFLQAGLSIFRMKHDGQRNFIVKLVGQNGVTVEFLANEIGAFDGSVAGKIPASAAYVLEVRADGNWSALVEQPRPAAVPNGPVSFSGRGKQVTAFFNLQPGLKVATMHHEGQRNFIVKLVNGQGSTTAFLANVIGGFDGSAAASASGIHLLEVTADGNWTVSIQ